MNKRGGSDSSDDDMKPIPADMPNIPRPAQKINMKEVNQDPNSSFEGKGKSWKNIFAKKKPKPKNFFQ